MLGRQEEYKEKVMLPRTDIAARLRRIADAVEDGSMMAGQLHVQVPDQARFKLEVEPDELEIELKWRR